MTPVPTTPESLFLAGFIGALSAFLLGWGPLFPWGQQDAPEDLRTAVLYALLGGYVATFVIGCSEVYFAFATGLALDLLLRSLRQLVRRWGASECATSHDLRND